jgi:ribosome biogenesis GTPase A
MDRVVREVINECDVIIEVADARDIEGTRSREIESLVRRLGKVLILAINKSDLARPKSIPKGNVVSLSATKRFGTKNLRTAMMAACAGREDAKVGIVGYANTGKSSVIRALGGRASISPRPGFTKGKHWARMSKHVMLLDSPGVIPRREEGEQALAIKGAYDITKLKDPEGAAMELIRKLGTKKLVKAYGVEPFDDPFEQLEELAGKWLMLQKGGVLDMNRASRRLLKDWQTGKLK